MCGRYNLRATPRELAEFFALFREPGWSPRDNIAPTQQIGAVRRLTVEGPREWTTLRWGLIPSWSKDATAAARMINARSETVAEKPSFRVPFRKRRCLIPASGYYEWSPQEAPAAGQGRKAAAKQPYLITVKERPVIAFAGLWERWNNPNGETWETATILTTEASSSLASLHDRMPVILAPEDFDLWLDPDFHDADVLRGLLVPFAADRMEAVPVPPLPAPGRSRSRASGESNQSPASATLSEAPKPNAAEHAAHRERSLFD